MAKPTSAIKQQDALMRALGKIEAKRQSRESYASDRARDFKLQLMAEISAEFEPQEAPLRSQIAALQDAVDAEKIAETVSMLTRWPLGTKFVEWESGSYGWQRELKRTGKIAVLEIFKRGDAFPANQRWRLPEVGALVLRLLKKDGSRGEKCVGCDGRNESNVSPAWGWYIEGHDPTKEKR